MVVRVKSPIAAFISKTHWSCWHLNTGCSSTCTLWILPIFLCQWRLFLYLFFFFFISSFWDKLCALLLVPSLLCWLGFCGLLLLSASIITSIFIYHILSSDSSFLVYLITILMIYVSKNTVFDIRVVVITVIIILTSTFCPRVVSVSWITFYIKILFILV